MFKDKTKGEETATDGRDYYSICLCHNKGRAVLSASRQTVKEGGGGGEHGTRTHSSRDFTRWWVLLPFCSSSPLALSPGVFAYHIHTEAPHAADGECSPWHFVLVMAVVHVAIARQATNHMIVTVLFTSSWKSLWPIDCLMHFDSRLVHFCII